MRKSPPPVSTPSGTITRRPHREMGAVSGGPTFGSARASANGMASMDDWVDDDGRRRGRVSVSTRTAAGRAVLERATSGRPDRPRVALLVAHGDCPERSSARGRRRRRRCRGTRGRRPAISRTLFAFSVIIFQESTIGLRASMRPCQTSPARSKDMQAVVITSAIRRGGKGVDRIPGGLPLLARQLNVGDPVRGRDGSGSAPPSPTQGCARCWWSRPAAPASVRAT